MNEITTVGVDLAKEVIMVCAGDAQGRPIYFKRFSFSGFGEWAAKLPPCVFGLEACSSAHHWARFLAARGHAPKLIAAELVTPFVRPQLVSTNELTPTEVEREEWIGNVQPLLLFLEVYDGSRTLVRGSNCCHVLQDSSDLLKLRNLTKRDTSDSCSQFLILDAHESWL